jgi:hypothetical protein
MKIITLTQGKEAIVDDSDFDLLSQWNWYAVNNSDRGFYAVANMEPGKPTRMHRFLLSINDPKIFVDHINHNGLDNQRVNLRTCTRLQNQRNRRSNKNSSSQYIGVSSCVHKKRGKEYKYWQSAIKTGEKSINLGLFPFTAEGEIQAAIVRDEASKKYHGEFANLNFKQ